MSVIRKKEVDFMATRITKVEETPDLNFELLRAPTVANALTVSLPQVYFLFHKGELPGVRIGRAIRFPKHLVLAYIKKQTTGAQ
jgi:excisionase family DNA binding protein